MFDVVEYVEYQPVVSLLEKWKRQNSQSPDIYRVFVRFLACRSNEI